MPSYLHFVPEHIRGATLSICLGCVTIAFRLTLTYASHGRFKSANRKRLELHDYLIWAELTVTALIALMLFLLRENSIHDVSSEQFIALGILGIGGLVFIPAYVSDNAYDDQGEVAEGRAVWWANLAAFGLLILAVSLGARLGG